MASSKLSVIFAYFLAAADLSSGGLPAYGANESCVSCVSLARVVDGDTLQVRLQGRTEDVRLIGINAPEVFHLTKKGKRKINQQGLRSKEHLEELINGGRQVCLEYDAAQRDKYNRLLAYVYLRNKVMLNERMVLDGFAAPYKVFPNVKYASLFSEAQRRRKALKKK